MPAKIGQIAICSNNTGSNEDFFLIDMSSVSNIRTEFAATKQEFDHVSSPHSKKEVDEY